MTVNLVHAQAKECSTSFVSWHENNAYSKMFRFNFGMTNSPVEAEGQLTLMQEGRDTNCLNKYLSSNVVV